MTIITEDYCSFETAKLLKEKGFLKGVDLRRTKNLSFYDSIGLTHNLNKYYDSLVQDKIDFVVAPTLQMALKWLREKNISIELSAARSHYWVYTIYKILSNKVEEIYPDGGFKTYEEAVEAAIKYALENLI